MSSQCFWCLKDIDGKERAKLEVWFRNICSGCLLQHFPNIYQKIYGDKEIQYQKIYSDKELKELQGYWDQPYQQMPLRSSRMDFKAVKVMR